MNRYANRFGKFRIDRSLIDDTPLDAAAMLAGMIVIRAELMFVDNSIEYVACHPDFAEIGHLSSFIPEYRVTVHRGRRVITAATMPAPNNPAPVKGAPKPAYTYDEEDIDDMPRRRRMPKSKVWAKSPKLMDCGCEVGLCICNPAAPTTPEESRTGTQQKPDFLRITRECSSHD